MIIHTVKPEDTIYSISKQYGIPEIRIITDNSLDPEKKLTPGQTLLICHPEKTYMVRGGDTLEHIAKESGISVLSILQNNPSIIQNKLTPSQTLNLSYEKKNARSIIVAAYTGSADLMRIEKQLPYISILTVQNAVRVQNGEIVYLQNTAPTVALAKKYRAMPILSLDCTDEKGKWSGSSMTQVLSSPIYTERWIQSAIEIAKSGGFSGVEIGAMGLMKADGYRFVEMLLALHGVCQDNDLICTSPILPFDGVDANEENIVDIASLIPLWSYVWDDEISSPAAPLDRQNNLLQNSIIQKYKEKMLLGIPTFGIDYIQIGNRYQKQVVNADSVHSLLQKHHITAQYNERTHTPYLQFTDSGNAGQRHLIQYEDARSLSEKLDLMDAANLGGVNIMSLEYDLPILWQLLNQRYTIQKF